GVGFVGVLLELVVHRLHEAVEVAALLVLEGQAMEEKIHQPRLTAPDAAPEINTSFGGASAFARQQLFEKPRPRRGREQSLPKILEPSHDALLCFIGGIAEARAFGTIGS